MTNATSATYNDGKTHIGVNARPELATMTALGSVVMTGGASLTFKRQGVTQARYIELNSLIVFSENERNFGKEVSIEKEGDVYVVTVTSTLKSYRFTFTEGFFNPDENIEIN